jgi:(1->4)-alpha-D-glucan 1-alpha-D-glucosylmutase
VKSIREAKRRSGWTEPNPGYERSAERFLAQLLAPGSAFTGDLEALVRRSAASGAVKSLVQTLLKLTAPGVPDLYQGTEFWDHSLVDPDNRRPVDYAARAAALAREGEDRDRLAHWQDGAVKQRLIARVLAARRQHPALFAGGAYLPLATRSGDGRPWLAFAREQGPERAVVLVPLAAAGWLDRDSLAMPPGAGRVEVELPAHWPQDLEWTAVLGTTPVAALAWLRAEVSPWPCGLYLAA